MINLKTFATRSRVSTEKRQWLRLTSACNNKCIFCSDAAEIDGSIVPVKELKIGIIKGVKSCRRIVLSGGEPTLHPDLAQIIEFSKAQGYKRVQIVTNGRMFANRDFADNIISSGLDEVTFSMHGHNHLLHDSQTQVRGSFSEALLGLVNVLRHKKVIINVDLVINKRNVDSLPDILNFFIKLGISEFDLLQVIPFGRAWDNRSKVFYDIEEHLAPLKEAFKLAQKKGAIIWTNRFPARYLEGFEDLIQHPVKLFNEVNDKRDRFDNFIKYGKVMACFGQRCRYCFLENFCRDLMELKKNRLIFSVPSPVCISKRTGIERKKVFFLNKPREVDILDFAKFFLKYRYAIKKMSCDLCKASDSCQGLLYDFSRKRSRT